MYNVEYAARRRNPNSKDPSGSRFHVSGIARPLKADIRALLHRVGVWDTIKPDGLQGSDASNESDPQTSFRSQKQLYSAVMSWHCSRRRKVGILKWHDRDP